MRLMCLIFSILAVFAGAAFAQGTKDPSNNSGINNGSKTQSPVETSRPTTVRNVPTNMLPSGSGFQRIYRDGKLQTIVR